MRGKICILLLSIYMGLVPFVVGERANFSPWSFKLLPLDWTLHQFHIDDAFYGKWSPLSMSFNLPMTTFSKFYYLKHSPRKTHFKSKVVLSKDHSLIWSKTNSNLYCQPERETLGWLNICAQKMIINDNK